jgi:phosphatidyl-myo-inositol dimannoside synthase
VENAQKSASGIGVMSSGQKILLLTSEFDPYRGGIGTYARELALAAVELGHNVTVVAPDYAADQTAADRAFPFEVRRYHGTTPSWSKLPERIRLVRSIASKETFDWVHAADWPFYLPLALSPFRRRTRCVVTFHGSEINLMRSPRRAIPVALSRFWNGWTNYVANSRFTAEHLVRTFPQTPKDKVFAIPLGVNASWLRGRVDRAEARARLNLPPDRFVLVSLGRLTPRKGHMIVGKALASLPPEMSRRIHWSIVGPAYEGDYAAALRQTVAASEIDGVFRGVLSQSEIELLLSAADAFCLPGFWDNKEQFEGFGLVYLEAGALGVPSIATDTGGVSDAVIDQISGILVPPNDVAAVAAAIRRLFENPDERAALAEGARAHAERSPWTRVARLTYALD